ncbi:MAG: NAD(P)(+) transhydrogenase (Re/Si-specific) subunit beta [Holosporales bacterium]|jgi:NAD(P) transhydrogenase subunit beta|nr:NAD(P)(+) transhydrogenase (Re/Si-specific) subunit beta [Holosporales bacterium]
MNQLPLPIAQLLYLIAAICFILSLKGLSSPQTARLGNTLGMCGMGVAVAVSLSLSRRYEYAALAIALGGGVGVVVAKNIKMTALPQLVAAFHSLVGAAAVLISWVTLCSPQLLQTSKLGCQMRIEIGIEAFIGAITFAGSVLAFCKLQGLGKKLSLPKPNIVNGVLGAVCLFLLMLFSLSNFDTLFWFVVPLSLALGVCLVIPIGGSDMPVVVSLLNSYSGWATAATGFTLGNYLLIITGAIVGSSGAILSYIMCKNMNRSIFKVIFGQMEHSQLSITAKNEKSATVGTPEDAAFLLANASTVIIVPGYGMAVAQAQRAVCEVAELLRKRETKVRYAIHPVAGRMPGHMNVLLAEANVPYEDVFELDDINGDFALTDVTLVVGANDVTNPAADNDPQSPIFGMPILRVENSKTVLFIKRSLGVGYAGVDNDLFYRANTMMIIGDAKKVCEGLVKELSRLG